MTKARPRSERRILPEIDGDPGPRAVGRGPLIAGLVPVMSYSAASNGWVPTTTKVVMRPRSTILARLPSDERDMAEVYAAWTEQRGSIRNVDPASSGSRRSSDGGAAHRWDADRNLANCHRAIGHGAALTPRYASDGREAVTIRDMVDLICIHGFSAHAVLARYGWSDRITHKQALKVHLRAALRRMQHATG